MIVDLKRLEGDKETWQFSTIVYWQGLEWKIKGWRYWPDSKVVKAPSVEFYKRRLSIVEFPSSQAEIIEMVEFALRGLKSSQTGSETSKDIRKVSDEQLLEYVQTIKDKEMSLETMKESFLAAKDEGKATDWDWQRLVELGGFDDSDGE